jgi:hypothetical protein
MKMTVAQLVMKTTAFYGTQRFITMFTGINRTLRKVFGPKHWQCKKYVTRGFVTYTGQLVFQGFENKGDVTERAWSSDMGDKM